MIYDYVHNPAEYDVEPRWWLFVDMSNEPARPLRDLTLYDPEVWMPVAGHEGAYEVSSHGRVRSLERVITYRRHGRTMKRKCGARILADVISNTYRVVALGRGNQVQVSVLVAATFIGPRPQRHYVLHGDGDSKNDSVSNLRYGTQFENIRDAIKHGTFARGTRMPTAKLTDHLASIAKGLRGLVPQEAIAKRFGCSRMTIHHAQAGDTWAHITPLDPACALDAFNQLPRQEPAA